MSPEPVEGKGSGQKCSCIEICSDSCLGMEQVLCQQSCRKGDERDKEQQETIPVEESMVVSLEQREDPMMMHPSDEHSEETDHEREVAWPKRSQRAREPVRRNHIVTGYFEFDDKQRHRDAEHPVTERFHAFSLLFFVHARGVGLLSVRLG